MSTVVKELQQNLFGGLHDFHTERTAVWIDAVREKLGDEVLELLQEKGTDNYGLYRWHLERSLGIIDILKEKYGEQATDIIHQKQLRDRREQGAQIAKELGNNELRDYIAFTTGGNDEKIITKSDTEVLIKSTGCLAGKIAFDINKGDMVYTLHCATDPSFVEGFNSKLGCEVVQTLMDGHDCCIHRIYIKD